MRVVGMNRDGSMWGGNAKHDPNPAATRLRVLRAQELLRQPTEGKNRRKREKARQRVRDQV